MSDEEIENNLVEEYISEAEVAEELEFTDDLMNIENEDLEILEDDGPIEGNDLQLDSEHQEFIDNSIQGFFKHKDSVYSIALCPGRRLAVSGGGDDCAYLWQLENGEELFPEVQYKFSESISSVGFSFDGIYFALGTLGGELAVYSTDSGILICNLEGPSDISWMAWHPKGYVLLCGSDDGSVWMWSVPSGACLRVFSGHNSPVTIGGFTPDGKKIISCTADGSLSIWNPKTADIMVKYGPMDRRFLAGSITSFITTFDANYVIAGGDDGTIKVALVSSSKIIASLDGHSDSVETLAISSLQSNILVSGGLDGRMNIWDLGSFKLRETCVHPEGITKIKFLANSFLILSSSIDGIIRLWDSRSGTLQQEWKGHQDSILDFDCSNNYIVTASDDGTALVFFIDKREP